MSIFDTKKFNFNEIEEFNSIDDLLQHSPSNFFKENWNPYITQLSEKYNLKGEDLKQIVDISYDAFNNTNLILGLKNSKFKDELLPTHQFTSDLNIDKEDFCIIYGQIEDRNKPRVGKFFLNDESVSEMVSYLCDEHFNY